MTRLLLLFAFASPLFATEIQCVGVLGNSGEAGPRLIRTHGTGSTGVALDPSYTLWLSGGDCINRVSLDGHLIERFPVELSPGYQIWSRNFMVLKETLYFTCFKGEECQLFAVPMHS